MIYIASKIKFIVLLLLLFNGVSTARAQTGYSWSDPVQLFQVEDTGELHYPTVISDQFGRIHVFWNFKTSVPGELDKIYYMRQDEAGWTFPVDIIATTPLSDINVAIGQDDFFYLTWQGNGDIISFSRAPIDEAEFVRSWSNPVQITDATSFYSSLVASPSGNIYLAYPSRGDLGVLFKSLELSDFNWSPPGIIASNSLVNTGSDYVQIAASSNGTLHVVWTEFYTPDNWPPRGIFYARSTDGGESWSPPVLLAGDGHDQVNISVLDDDHIHVAWNGMVTIGGRYHRWSDDGGQTWSETIETIPAGIGGTEGFPQIVGDQLGILHMLTTYDGCVWYTFFKNQVWATPVCISGEKAGASNFIEEPALGISEGNKLHAVFWDDRKRLWYTSKLIDAPGIPPQVVETAYTPVESQPGTTLTPSVLPTIQETELPAGHELDTTFQNYRNPGQLLMFSILPVILLIIVVGAIKFIQRIR